MHAETEGLTVHGAMEAVKQLSLPRNEDSRPKVDQLDSKVTVNDNVFVLDISVTDAFRV